MPMPCPSRPVNSSQGGPSAGRLLLRPGRRALREDKRHRALH